MVTRGVVKRHEEQPSAVWDHSLSTVSPVMHDKTPHYVLYCDSNQLWTSAAECSYIPYARLTIVMHANTCKTIGAHILCSSVTSFKLACQYTLLGLCQFDTILY